MWHTLSVFLALLYECAIPEIKAEIMQIVLQQKCTPMLDRFYVFPYWPWVLGFWKK
jgi:hypothetical protein